MALPGVAKLTAMTLVAEIGNIGRFPTARKLCAFTGLTPQVRNSDRKVHPRPHHQPGLALGAGDPPRRPPRPPNATHVHRRLRRAGPPPRQEHRHGSHRPAAAGPLLLGAPPP